MPRAKNCIAIEDCRHGFLYRLKSRNLAMGVYNEQEKGFIGMREKFRARFLSVEYHWDTGAPHGTASPIEEIGELPAGMPMDTASAELYQWIDAAEKNLYQPDVEDD